METKMHEDQIKILIKVVKPLIEQVNTFRFIQTTDSDTGETKRLSNEIS